MLFRSGEGRAFSIAANGLEPKLYPDGRTGCPLYAADTPYHCTVYEARPLICRLFAFSAVKNKRGEPSYSLCRLMPDAPDKPGVRSAAGSALDSAFSRAGNAAKPPVMADLGAELVGLDPASAGERSPLPEALMRALSKLLFLVGLDDRRDPENDGPNLSPPVPNAS